MNDNDKINALIKARSLLTDVKMNEPGEHTYIKRSINAASLCIENAWTMIESRGSENG